MQKELKYNGYAAVPSDYECQDGDLAAVLGLIPDKGALHPVAEPVNVLSYAGTILFVHETSKFKHYIGFLDTGSKAFHWIDSATPTTTHAITKPYYNIALADIIQVNALGNTLVVLTVNGLYYYLWKADNSSYQLLADHLPELPIQFGLQGTYCSDDMTESTAMCVLEKPLSYAASTIQGKINKEDIVNVTNLILGQANKWIEKFGTSAGRFTQPFFVRYAYRMFDGSLVMHSAPVYMLTSSDVNPIVQGGVTRSDNLTDKADLAFGNAHGMAFDLDYKVLDSDLLTELRGWSDIVKSIDIFVSAPLYKYRMDGGDVEEFYTETDKTKGYSVCKLLDWADTYDDIPKRYQKLPLYYAWNWCRDEHFSPMKRWKLPTFTDGEFSEKVSGCSSFYLLKSIPLEELSLSITKIDIDPEYLQSLVAREAMDDDYDSHANLIPRFSYPYNSRLNLCDITKKAFRGFENGSAIARTTGYIGPTSSVNDYPSTDDDNRETVRVFVYLKKDGKTIIVRDFRSYSHAFNSPILYYYYPDTDAYQAVFEFTATTGIVHYYKVNMAPHTGLNGSIFFSNGLSVKDVGSQLSGTPTVSQDLSFEVRNKIYTSEVNNPFLFPVLNINTVGNGRIMAIASAAKALSQGQFGQFPMYAFSTDGVWALEVSATTGAFSGRQPITRDICLNANSIAQIDSAVLFASDRGIMLLTGSNAQCITDGIDNNGEPFNFGAMPHAGDIKTLLGITAGDNDALTEKAFRTFIDGCQMLYAYNRQHIIVFNPSFSYAYVYSLESKQWGLIQSSLTARVNSYPQAYAMRPVNGQTMLVDYSLENGISGSQFLLTRPLKLDAGAKDVLKTIDTIIQRGDFAKGHVQTILYGSRDLINWFTVFSSQDHYLRGFRGTPYKYYRIALVCTLTHKESIYGATVQFNARLTDQPR